MNVGEILLTVAVACLALGVSAGVGAPLTGWLLGRIARRTEPENEPGDQPEDAQALEPEPTAAEVLRGGLWIGILERFAITGCILVGYPAGIAVIVAIKGLGRFRSLDGHANVAERFLVGTLASYLWAALIGLGGLALFHLIG
ncbi:hypothetical protein IM660_09865 [Ruania alkalisoli]|uniref:Uncharacterized protein n=1 Tax=Ruania alkalisoli TaxID=2779775 RepID=A0A7M1T0S9_9MICO|nr:hypothetical protein [Ruania alkalisoli]QOR72493.1 hypothetical protein IM660_09865 [Ruania alkalisoli]